MWRSMAKVAAATAAFGLVHSALASRTAKRAAARALGERDRDGLYRISYNALSAASLGLLVAYIRRQPSRELYRVEGPAALLMHAGQAGAAVGAVAGAGQVGFLRFSGVESLAAWVGDGPIPPAPEAQGPALDEEGLGRPLGPFAWNRHPLNSAMVPILWLWPRMTTNLLAFNAVATVYVIVGSLREEARLRAAYGDRYDSYAQAVPFFIPAPGRSPLTPTAALAQSRRNP